MEEQVRVRQTCAPRSLGLLCVVSTAKHLENASCSISMPSSLHMKHTGTVHTRVLVASLSQPSTGTYPYSTQL